ncbi:amidohydrolase family protein [Novosphingobium flavum]|uniref:Amidohydrolase family protein n=1 Tax=Novosphingobium flavum TaxID=1778672 RepID=A0A7X1FRP3_9SPHN|nr:amidohydrolase family protein [Novosphingobium flavum]MBC2665693.1 amidohydrolase family protein [Novosphingobium flavum]
MTLEPELAIVDPHHHFIGEPAHRYMFDHFVSDVSSGHNVVGSVHVEAGTGYKGTGPVELRPVGETEFVNGMAALSASGNFGPKGLCCGIVGYADLRLGAHVVPVLEAHIAAGGGRFRAVRDSTVWSDDPALPPVRGPYPASDLMLQDDYQAGVMELGRLGLAYEAWLFQHQLPQLAALAAKAGSTRIILDHGGGPVGVGRNARDRPAAFRQWQDELRKLAQFDNIYLKVGGFGMPQVGLFEPQQPGTDAAGIAERERHHIESCVEIFTPERCMFESNFPIESITSRSYHDIWNAFKIVTTNWTEHEKSRLFSRTANEVYELGLF